MGDKYYRYTVTLTYSRVVEDIIAQDSEDAISEVVNDGSGQSGELVESSAEEVEEIEEGEDEEND